MRAALARLNLGLTDQDVDKLIYRLQTSSSPVPGSSSSSSKGLIPTAALMRLVEELQPLGARQMDNGQAVTLYHNKPATRAKKKVQGSQGCGDNMEDADDEELGSPTTKGRFTGMNHVQVPPPAHNQSQL